MSDDPREQLPKRSAEQLAHDLRGRARFVTGAAWEGPATAAMMNEAADQLDASARALRDARDDMERLKAENQQFRDGVFAAPILSMTDREVRFIAGAQRDIRAQDQLARRTAEASLASLRQSLANLEAHMREILAINQKANPTPPHLPLTVSTHHVIAWAKHLRILCGAPTQEEQ